MRLPSIQIKKSLTLIKTHKLVTVLIILWLILLSLMPMGYTFITTAAKRYDLRNTPIEKVPYHKVAIVFGAGINNNSTPTPYLSYRLKTAVKLFKAHRVRILLMTGDNSVKHHNEPMVMKKYAIKLGVPSQNIVEDFAGFNTYDSCFRAKVIFKVNSATLISQGYHLPRAMATCSGLGVANVGVIALHPSRDYTLNYLAREVLSTDKMMLQLLFKPNPTILGKPLPIKLK